jgi:hypothetical protein
MINRYLSNLLIAGFCACTTVVHGQDNINTDRPDQTDGASVVDEKSLQLESEFYYNKFGSGKLALISSSLLRYGLLKNVEARLLVEQGQERDLFIRKLRREYIRWH